MIFGIRLVARCQSERVWEQPRPGRSQVKHQGDHLTSATGIGTTILAAKVVG